jgi:hypothetical protein
MSRLETLSFDTVNLSKSFRSAKQKRIEAEEQVQKLKNRIGSLKLKTQLSARKIERFRALTEKIETVRKDKIDSREKSETKRKEDKEAMLAQNKVIRMGLYQSKLNKMENLNRIVTERREGYKMIKEKQRFDEIFIVEQFERAKDENSRVKKIMGTWKAEETLDRIESGKKKMEEGRSSLLERLNRENRIVWIKAKEKEIMENADLRMIECLHNGLLQ